MSRTKSRKSNGKVRPHEQVQYTLAPPMPVMPSLPSYPVPPAPHVSVQVLHDRNASVANVQLVKRTAEYFEPPLWEKNASGSAKREPGDVHDEGTAELFALSRAFLDLSRQLESEARKRVRAAAEAEDARKERIAEKHEKLVSSPHHRTFEEWQEIKERAADAQSRLTQAQRNAQLAQNLGLGPVAVEFLGRLSSVFTIPPLPALPENGETAYAPRHGDNPPA